MSNKNNKVGKRIGVINAIAALTLTSSITSPVAVMAENRLIKSKDDGYGFTYTKTTTKKDRKPSLYVLELREILDSTGKASTANDKEKEIASKVLQNSDDISERRVEVDYDGLYNLKSIQREPGHFPYLNNSMHLSDGYFEFPKEGDNKIVQKVSLKEEEFLKNFELILRNVSNLGLKGKFDIIQIAEPLEVYGGYTESEITFKKDEAISLGYNMPQKEEDKNRVKEWSKTKDKKFGEINIDPYSKLPWMIGQNKAEVDYGAKLESPIEEGIYKISQVDWEMGYIPREDVLFKVELDNKGEPQLSFIDNEEDLKEMDFLKKSDVEFFKYGKYTGAPEDIKSIYQSLLINHPIPGMRPDKPGLPNSSKPNRPHAIHVVQDFEKFTVRKSHLNFELGDKQMYPPKVGSGGNYEGEWSGAINDWEDFDPDDYFTDGGEINYEEGGASGGWYTEVQGKDGEMVKVPSKNFPMTKGDYMKVNVGEYFDFSFDIYIPENISDYNSLLFNDILENNIMASSKFSKDSITIREFYSFDKDGQDINHVIKSVDFGFEEDKKYIDVDFDIDELSKYAGKRISINIGDLYLRKDTREDVKNRGYLYFNSPTYSVDRVGNPWEKPIDKDVISPITKWNTGGSSLDRDFNVNINDKDARPFIPTTNEVIVDPITIDFRMGVVDGGTTILDNAEYEILSFKPSRGYGGINEDGNLYIEEVIFDINEIIDAGEGFVKLNDLPAGEYVMIETNAPVKNNDKYRLVTGELKFKVHENEKDVYIFNPIVKNKEELIGDKIDAVALYRKDKTVYIDDDKWNSKDVLDKEAMLHHYKFINTPETGTLAQIPYIIGGSAAIIGSVGVTMRKRKRS